MIDTIAKAIHNHLASQAPSDGHIRYWEIAPAPVKDFARGLAKVAVKAIRDIPNDVLFDGVVDRFPDGEPMTMARWRENWEGIVDTILKDEKSE